MMRASGPCHLDWAADTRSSWSWYRWPPGWLCPPSAQVRKHDKNCQTFLIHVMLMHWLTAFRLAFSISVKSSSSLVPSAPPTFSLTFWIKKHANICIEVTRLHVLNETCNCSNGNVKLYLIWGSHRFCPRMYIVCLHVLKHQCYFP